MPDLILASTSTYRAELLQRLRVPFQARRPLVDETPLPGEPPQSLAVRLARTKAQTVAEQCQGAWVIGSDQTADLDGVPIGKPGGRAAALAQLEAMSGRAVEFHTSVCLTDGTRWLEATDVTRVVLRSLPAEQIARYVDAETPYDCAGSFKCEGLGISLFEAIETRDPTALIGLPLIATARLLRDAGFRIP